MLGPMQGNSPPVRSRQRVVHARLDDVVRRHLASPWRAPVHAPTALALAPLLAELADGRTPVVLDSGCGDGASTLRLAYRHPDALVVGLDKSALRLQRLAPGGSLRRGNLWLLRAELAQAWQLLAAAGVRLAGHYLLYPNPWPKSTQLHRRWHGHPVFPSLLALGGALELRSNWPVYVAEFARALELAGAEGQVEPVEEAEPALTPFERKYRDSGHPLWRLRAQLGAGS
jgi:tRNA (guanine-N7-)-methyltransferase